MSLKGFEKVELKAMRAPTSHTEAPAGLSMGERVAQGRRALGDAEGAVGGCRALFVPGRIEVVGKHTDYAGGRSLLAATRQGFCVVFRSREDNLLRVWDLTAGVEGECRLSPALPPTGNWENYLRAVARRLASNFGNLHGAEVAFSSDLPRSAGMSSSSALVVSLYLVLASVNRLEARPAYCEVIGSHEDLGEYLGAVENGLGFRSLSSEAGVGTFGGSEDQTAILCSEAGRLRQYSYCPVRHERTVDVPDGLEFAIGVSGVTASKTGSAMGAYNRASRLASAAAEAWRRGTGGYEPHLAAVLETGVSPDEVESVLSGQNVDGFTGEELVRRFRHFALESGELVNAASEAMAVGDVDRFGEVLDRSQRSVENLLDNQIEETIFLARSARELGARAASAFGAGFGGSVWALVERKLMGTFLEDWQARYLEVFPQNHGGARFTSTPPAQGARPLDTGGKA
jgi:galactokinase